jgi:hypothetical protein
MMAVIAIFVRAPDLAHAGRILTALIPAGDGLNSSGAAGLSTGEVGLLLGLASTTLIGMWLLRDSSVEHVADRFPWWLRAAVLAVMLVCLALAPGDDRAFFYFQF